MLGITDKQPLHEEEARGVVRAEAFLLDLELPVALTTGLLLDFTGSQLARAYSS